MGFTSRKMCDIMPMLHKIQLTNYARVLSVSYGSFMLIPNMSINKFGKNANFTWHISKSFLVVC